MEILGLSTLATVVLTGLVAGGVELIKRIFDKDWRTVARVDKPRISILFSLFLCD